MKKPVHLNHFFPEPPEVVFDAYLDPSKIKQWYSGSADSEIISVEIEPKIGGNFSIIELTSDKKEIEHSGKYMYIHRPNWIVFTLQVPQIFTGSTEVSINIREEEGGSRLVFLQIGIKLDLGDFWQRKMEQLGKVLGGK